MNMFLAKRLKVCHSPPPIPPNTDENNMMGSQIFFPFLQAIRGPQLVLADCCLKDEMLHPGHLHPS